MSKSTDLLCEVLELFPNWESAIADAETGALEAERRAVRLRAVADVFKRKKEAGEPWPRSAAEPTTQFHESTRN
jgi:hypothetical protein